MRKFTAGPCLHRDPTPRKLIAAAGESGGSGVFKVDYFGRNAYLAQSPQFYKQMAMAAGFRRIFETGYVPRGRTHQQAFHEFSGFDLEFASIFL